MSSRAGYKCETYAAVVGRMRQGQLRDLGEEAVNIHALVTDILQASEGRELDSYIYIPHIHMHS